MYRIALSLSILFLPWCLSADTAEDYFHRGAQYYVWGQKQKSKSEITTGLTLYPTDALLNGMAGLLQKEEQQQNQQQQQQQQSQQQQSQDSQKQEQQAQQEQQQQQQPQPEQPNQEQQAAAAQEEKASEEKEAAQAKAEGRMTPEEARQLLDAQKGEEQYLNLQQNQKPRDRNRSFKDW